MPKRIFTFWEPKESIPGYLELCLDSWQKFLPDYEIVILDYSNLNKWLGENYYPEFLYNNFSLPIQSDAIRCAILKKYGGIWMDVDTVITNKNIEKILSIQSDFTLINKHIAFICADKNSRILNKWHKGIKKNLNLYSIYNNEKTSKLVKWYIRKFYSENFYAWNFLGNLILKKPLKTKSKRHLYKISAKEIKALPELCDDSTNVTNLQENYTNFYFQNDFSDFALKDNGGIILLHNSWTPEKYKKMNKEEFLAANNTISNILRKIL